MGNDFSPEVRIAALQRVPIFGGISEEVIASLLERTTIVERAKGDYFFEQGDSGTSAFVLERGEVSILRRYDGGAPTKASAPDPGSPGGP